jgi:hypothetical protein
MENKPKRVIVEFSPEAKAAFESDMQEVLKKHAALLVCKPFINNEGRVEAVLQVFKEEVQIPSPYVATENTTNEGGVAVAKEGDTPKS